MSAFRDSTVCRVSERRFQKRRFFERLMPGRLHAGLTMIELLVVVSILGILFVLITMQVAQYIARGQDSERKSQLEKYRIAFEEYYADNRRYPPESAVENCNSQDLAPYMARVLCDPVTEEPYRYVRSADGTRYSMWVDLAVDDDPVIQSQGCAAGCGPDDDEDGQGDYDYGISYDKVGGGDYSIDGDGEGEEQETVEPLCSSGDELYCIAGQCSVCCPGSTRCNGSGTACYTDNTCGD